METPKFHELKQPLKDITNHFLEKLGDWAIGDALTDLINGVQQESAERTAEMFSQGQLFQD